MTIDEFQGLSLATLARLTQKPLSNWSRWAKGRKMNSQTLLECAQKLSMNPDDLFKALKMRTSK